MDSVNIARVQTNRMSCLCSCISVLEEIVWLCWWTGHFACTVKTENEEIQNETVVLEDETGELKTSNQTISINVGHVLVCQNNVVLRCAVICQVVIHDESQQPIKEREIHLFVDFGQLRFNHNVAFAIGCLPDVVQVIDTLAPLIYEQWRWLSIGGLDPGREETSLIGFEVEELIKIGICDLLHWLDVVARNELLICIEELDSSLLEVSLGKQETFDTG
jgi:hypothetical protein